MNSFGGPKRLHSRDRFESAGSGHLRGDWNFAGRPKAPVDVPMVQGRAVAGGGSKLHAVAGVVSTTGCVEFAVDAQKRGETIRDAAVEGARLRLRPILMTSLAFIAASSRSRSRPGPAPPAGTISAPA